MPGIINEVVANSNSKGLVFSTAVLANTLANGSSIKIYVGGFVAPGVFGSSTYPPTAHIDIYAGANGNSNDPLVSTIEIPEVTGHFSTAAIITVRANAKSAGATANAVYNGLVVSPFTIHFASAANGNVNSAWSASNTGNISIYALAGSGQNANLVIETCFVTTQT